MDDLLPGSSAGPVFTSSRVLRWSSMTDDERDRFARFCAESNVAFFKDTDGSYAANIRLYDASVIDAAATFGARRPQTAQKNGSSNKGPDASMSRAGTSRGLGPGALFDYSVYPTFVGLVGGKESVKPKERPLPWLMRLIEEIYDSRYAKDTADLRGEADEGANSSSQPFPAFVVEFFSKRYGLRGLIDQNCWDLLYNTHRLRKEHLEVEMFGRFLEEYYDPDDLLFFTYVRSMVQKEIGINFRARWSEMGRNAVEANSPSKAGQAPSSGGLPPPLTLSYRESQLVARVVFGSEADPLYKTFLAMVERNMTGSAAASTVAGRPKTAGQDTRRIDVTQFMHIALVEYHETRPAESLADGGSARGGEDALLREAEAAYDARASAASLGVSGVGPMGTSAVSMGSPGLITSPTLRPSPALLEALGEAMHRNNEAFLDRALGSADTTALPREVQSQIRQEVQAQLEAKVDSVLAAVITVTQSGGSVSSGSTEIDSLARQFSDLVRSAGSAGASGAAAGIQAFCEGVLGSSEVRSTVDQLVQLLVQYATTRMQEGAK